jgi:DNA gyrase/topoisomerase IV subunit A
LLPRPRSPLSQLAQAKQALEEARGSMRAPSRPDSRSQSREELRKIDIDSARLKRECARMRVQLEAAVHDENVTRLQNLLTERSKEHDAISAENQLLQRQLRQLQPLEDEECLDEQRALAEEHAQLTARLKKYQKLHRLDEQRRQKLQREYTQASVRADRLKKELKLEQVGRTRAPSRCTRARGTGSARLDRAAKLSPHRPSPPTPSAHRPMSSLASRLLPRLLPLAPRALRRAR